MTRADQRKITTVGSKRILSRSAIATTVASTNPMRESSYRLSIIPEFCASLRSSALRLPFLRFSAENRLDQPFVRPLLPNEPLGDRQPRAVTGTTRSYCDVSRNLTVRWCQSSSRSAAAQSGPVSTSIGGTIDQTLCRATPRSVLRYLSGRYRQLQPATDAIASLDGAKHIR
jgi:hypothetical protein